MLQLLIFCLVSLGGADDGHSPIASPISSVTEDAETALGLRLPRTGCRAVGRFRVTEAAFAMQRRRVFLVVFLDSVDLISRELALALPDFLPQVQFLILLDISQVTLV